MEANVVDEGLAALGQFVVGQVSLGDTLQRVAELTTEAVGSAEYAGITMMSERGPTTAVFTHPVAPEIDQAQYETGRGPCLDAYRGGEVQRIRSTITDERWPEFSQLAAEHGILSTLSLPMGVAERTIGALNLYSLVEDGFGGEE